MAGKAKTIGFKLGDDKLEALEELARKAGKTPHEFTRDVLLDRLNGQGDIHGLHLRISSLETEMSELRKDMSVSVRAILVTAGKVPIEEAEEFVRDNLRGK